MNCEHVFEILTRGPFPRGESSDALVERHLRFCHDCRQLAEALRPAVTLLHECLEGQEATDLPGYRGLLDANFWEQQPVDERPRWNDSASSFPYGHSSLDGVPGFDGARDSGESRAPFEARVSHDARAPHDDRSEAANGYVDGRLRFRSRLSRSLWGTLSTGVLAGVLVVALFGISREFIPVAETSGPPAFGDVPGQFTASLDERGSRLLARLPLSAACRDVDRRAPGVLPTSGVSPTSGDDRLLADQERWLDKNSSPNERHWAGGRIAYACCTLCHAAGQSVLTTTEASGMPDGDVSIGSGLAIPAPPGVPVVSSLALATTLRSCEACHRASSAPESGWRLPSL